MEELCKQCGGQDSSCRVIIAKHAVRDERDDLTDIARIHRIKTTPTFAVFHGAALLETWSGGNRQQLHAAVDRHRRRIAAQLQ